MSCLGIADSLFSMVVVAPLVVGYWRGTWNLLDLTLFPQHWEFSCWLSLAIGITVSFTTTVLQRPLKRWLTPRLPCGLYFISSRLYTVVSCYGCANQWRGVWATLDYYTGMHWHSAAASVAIGVAGLIALRAFRNVLAPPTVIVLDEPKNYFTFPTMFRSQWKDGRHIFLLDSFFTVSVVGSLVVFVWRGSFMLLDLWVFPSSSHWNALGCTVLGYAITVIVFSLQLPMASLCSRLKGNFRLALLEVYYAVAFSGGVNVWKGLWGIYDLYLLPDNKLLSSLITHGAGLVTLVVLYSGHSILVRGVYLDGEEEGAKAAFFPYRYSRYFFEAYQRRVSKSRIRPTENGHMEELQTMVIQSEAELGATDHQEMQKPYPQSLQLATSKDPNSKDC